MSNDDDLDDIWTFGSSATRVVSAPKPSLKIEQIDGVEPLDAQFGVDQPKTVPDALYEQLFGQPDSTEAEFTAAGDDSANIPPLQTYAILDAAKIINLPEMLSASGLEHRCFFKGQVYDELKAVAPWLVRLQENNAFSRNLFTKSHAPWHLWGREQGLYLRSRQPFDRLWQHLRKFTKVEGETSGTSFLRYWEVQTLEAFAVWSEMFPSINKMLSVIFGKSRIFFYAAHHDNFFKITPAIDEGQKRLPNGLRADLKRARFYTNMFDQADDFYTSYPVEAARYGEDAKALRKPLVEAVNEIYEAGLTDPQLRARFLLLAIIRYPNMWPAICDEPGWQAIRADPANADNRFRDLCAVMKHYSARRQGAFETWW